MCNGCVLCCSEWKSDKKKIIFIINCQNITCKQQFLNVYLICNFLIHNSLALDFQVAITLLILRKNNAVQSLTDEYWRKYNCIKKYSVTSKHWASCLADESTELYHTESLHPLLHPVTAVALSQRQKILSVSLQCHKNGSGHNELADFSSDVCFMNTKFIWKRYRILQLCTH
jgi:hypothetical protein